MTTGNADSVRGPVAPPTRFSGLARVDIRRAASEGNMSLYDKAVAIKTLEDRKEGYTNATICKTIVEPAGNMPILRVMYANWAMLPPEAQECALYVPSSLLKLPAFAMCHWAECHKCMRKYGVTIDLYKLIQRCILERMDVGTFQILVHKLIGVEVTDIKREAMEALGWTYAGIRTPRPGELAYRANGSKFHTGIEHNARKEKIGYVFVNETAEVHARTMECMPTMLKGYRYYGLVNLCELLDTDMCTWGVCDTYFPASHARAQGRPDSFKVHHIEQIPQTVTARQAELKLEFHGERVRIT